MRKYTLEIRFRRMVDDHGSIQPVPNKKNRYIIDINEKHPLLSQVGTLIHEFCHLIFYLFFSAESIDEKKEHELCEKLDRAAVRGFKRYIDGK